MSCGTQSTYNRVANAGNLHRLSPFQMPFGILHNLTGKSSLTFSIEKCHFITAIANRYGVSKYMLDERVKKAQMQMHIPPEDIRIGAAVGVLLPDIGPEVFPAKVEYIHPEGRFVTVRRSSGRKNWGDPYADSSYLFSVRPEEVLEVVS